MRVSDFARSSRLPGPARLTAVLAGLAPRLPEFADWALAYLVDHRGRIVRLDGAHATPDGRKLVQGITAYYQNPSSLEALARPGFHPARSVLEGAPVTLYQLHGWTPEPGNPHEAHLRLLQSLGLASIAVAPISSDDRTAGAVAFGRTADRERFRAADLTEACRLASAY